MEWDDIIGLEDAKEALRETLVWPRLHGNLLQALGLAPATGLLVYGPPGTGKTMLARAAASEAGVSIHAPLNQPLQSVSTVNQSICQLVSQSVSQ